MIKAVSACRFCLLGSASLSSSNLTISVSPSYAATIKAVSSYSFVLFISTPWSINAIAKLKSFEFRASLILSTKTTSDSGPAPKSTVASKHKTPIINKTFFITYLFYLNHFYMHHTYHQQQSTLLGWPLVLQLLAHSTNSPLYQNHSALKNHYNLP